MSIVLAAALTASQLAGIHSGCAAAFSGASVAMERERLLCVIRAQRLAAQDAGARSQAACRHALKAARGFDARVRSVTLRYDASPAVLCSENAR